VAKNNVAKNKPVVLPKVNRLVVAFVIYHIIAITIYSLPKPSDAVLEGKVEPKGTDHVLLYNHVVLKESAPFYAYLYTTGFWQYWDMFAPDPSQSDLWLDAEVEYLDGTKKIYEYPHMKKMSLAEKFIYERHRKFTERVNMETVQAQFLRAPFGQAIATKTATNPDNPPVIVRINRHFLDVPRHDKPVGPEPPYGKYTFFIYVVDQHKLFADKGWKLGIH
jgi:hypothetical protein